MKALRYYIITILILGFAGASASVSAQDVAALKVGAAQTDITPVNFPSICGGTMVELWYDKVLDPLSARCIVIENKEITLALVIVDSNMIPRSVCDEAKKKAHELTGIPINRILISATHTHAAPSVMNFALGLSADEAYAKMLAAKIADGIALAHVRLKPAKMGWTVFDAPEFTHCRRWVREAGKYQRDPFGEMTVRASLGKAKHAAGPVDEQLSLLSFVSLEGDQPIALLANFSMHYFRYKPGGFSADYFGLFSDTLAKKIVAKNEAAGNMLVAMSQGTSGDCGWQNHAGPSKYPKMQEYSTRLADVAYQAYQKIEYKEKIPLSMLESKLLITRRLPSKKRLAWAEKINQVRGDKRPGNTPEVYAEQVTWIDQNQDEELVLQVIRLGEIALTAMPNEVYGVTGLKLKAQSPFKATFNLSLANGAAGYIPPPEQHYLGGYTTWPSRTAGLEVNAEPKIVDTLLGMLEKLSGGKKRKNLTTDFYTEQQRQSLKDAKAVNNNAENRGANRDK
ncbi:MAG: hypothetical protein QM496_16755 [Verrucomicrobiota bacterium]